MTQEDFRRLKRGKLLILLIKKTHPVYVSNKYILGPMNKHLRGKLLILSVKHKKRTLFMLAISIYLDP